MVQQETETFPLAPLYQWLEIRQGSIRHQFSFVLRARLKNVKRITSTVVERDKEQDLVLSHHNSLNLSDLQNILAHHFSYNKVTDPVNGAPDLHFVRQ